MGFLDGIVDKAFRDQNCGRVVIFAGDGGGRGYVVGSAAEEAKIRSFLRMFYFANYSIGLLGSSLAFAWSTFFTNLESFGRPEAHILRTVCIYLGITLLLVGIPDVLLWRSYKKSIRSFVPIESAVVVSGRSAGPKPWIVDPAIAMLLVLLAIICFNLIRAK
jgi:hypothetical protein